jgi:hypothetical protein
VAKAARKDYEMTSRPPQISPVNASVLTMVYRKLLDNRQAMIDGMEAVEESPQRRGVLVDALISGLMTHFHEFARNEPAHMGEILEAGPGFGAYANGFVDQVHTVLTQMRRRGGPPGDGDPELDSRHQRM